MTLRRSIWRLFCILGAVGIVGAGAPAISPRPVPRPVWYPVPTLPLSHPSTRAEQAGLGVVLQNIFRPVPRGRIIDDAVAQAVILPPPYDPDLAIRRSPRPVLRPDRFTRLASVQPPPANVGSRRGSVCGQRQIRGVVLSAIRERVAGCGVANPVRISSVSGVRLTQDAIMDCNTATTLNDWVRQGAIPAVGRRGHGLEALRVISHYSCRTRNNQAGARISEHGKGRAIDIAGVILKNGDRIDFLDDWGSGRDGRILRALHSTACGPFGTVLGPEANRAHRDHLHVDTAEYRGGSYCR